jgi:general secretion pathway protein A
MYQSHWGLRESPFRNCLDPQAFYQSPTHDEALARLHFLVDEHRRLGLLMGPPGSGKSLLLEVLAAQLRRRGRPVAKVGLLGVEPAEMLSLVASQLGLSLDRTDSMGPLWRALTDRLAEYRYQQLETVVLLDDVDQAARSLFPHIVRLAKHDPSPESRLVVVLAGQRERMGRLGQPLLELAELRIDVEPWQPSDTADFLQTSLARAGRDSPLFAEAAVDCLHQLAHGIPRHVRQLADLALLAGAGRNLQRIDAETVESAYQELGLVEA